MCMHVVRSMQSFAALERISGDGCYKEPNSLENQEKYL